MYTSIHSEHFLLRIALLLHVVHKWVTKIISLDARIRNILLQRSINIPLFLRWKITHTKEIANVRYVEFVKFSSSKRGSVIYLCKYDRVDTYVEGVFFGHSYDSINCK